jgi:hypothetical protein
MRNVLLFLIVNTPIESGAVVMSADQVAAGNLRLEKLSIYPAKDNESTANWLKTNDFIHFFNFIILGQDNEIEEKQLPKCRPFEYQQIAVNALPNCRKDFNLPNCPKLAGTFSAICTAASLGW